MYLALKTSLLTLFFFTFFLTRGSAYKFYGAEIYYSYNGNTSYILNLDVFAPCTALPASSVITVSDGNTSKTYTLSYCCASDITPVPKGQCLYCSNAACSFKFGIKKYQYSASADLSDFKGCDLKISWSGCCGDSLTNINIGAAGIYVECRLNRCIREPNSPRFLFKPVMAFQVNCLSDQYQIVKPVSSADSIVYKLVPPHSDSSTTISYKSGFSYKEPITYYGTNASAPKPAGFHYDAVTGELWFNPLKKESSFITIEADEYTRDGNGKYYLVGSTMRAFMMESFSASGSKSSAPVIERTDGLSGDTIIACAGIPLNISIKGYDPDADSVFLEQYEESPGSFNLQPYFQYYKGSYTWTPAKLNISKIPYSIILSIRDNERPVYNFTQRRFYIFVKDSLPVFTVSASVSGCGNYAFATTKPIDSSNNITYRWYFDTTYISSAKSGTYKSTLAGTHKITLTVSNTSQCSVSASSTVFYDTAFQKLPALAGICKGSSIHLFAASGKNLAWLPSAGLSSSGIADPVANPSATTVYTVSGNDSSGCTYTDRIKILVSDFNLSTSGNRSSCPGSPVKLWATYNPDAVYFWEPDSLTGLAYYDDTVTVYPQKTTSFKVTVTLNGCIKTDSLVININPQSVDLGGALTVCPGDSFLMQGTLVKGASYQWMDAQHNILIPGATGISYWGKAGIYRPNGQSFGLTMTDTVGCKTTGIKNISIKKFIPAVSGNTIICRGDSALLVLSGGNKFHWSNDSFSSDSSAIKVSPTKTTIFKYSITDTLPGCSTSDSIEVVVRPRPAAAFHNASICRGDSLMLIVNGGSSFNWSPAAGLLNGSTANPVASPKFTTTYHVLIRDFSDNCVQKDSIKVNVTRCVWPGDANLDATADFTDVLNIGVGFGAKGPSRSPLSTQWKKQLVDDWSQTLTDSTNYKYLDCNGDGIINAADTAVINQNYGFKHNKWTPGTGNVNDPQLYFRFIRDTFYGGDTAIAWLYAGSANKPLTGAYGAAYQASCSGIPIKDSSQVLEPFCDFFCTGTELIYRGPDQKSNRFTRVTVETNGKATINTTGRIAQLKLTLKDSATHKYPLNGERIYAHLLNALVIDSTGKEIPVYGMDDSAVVMKPKLILSGIKKENNDRNRIRIYPNPAHNFVKISSEDPQHRQIFIYNTLGQIVYSGTSDIAHSEIDLSALKGGIYTIEVHSDKNLVRKKLIIQH
jgi:hypothetical protein